MFKGQATLEFLGGMIIFLITLVGSLTVASGNVPDFQDGLQQSEKNMEIYSMTERVLSSPGYHTNGSGGSDWENHVNSTTELGLANDYLILEKDKVDALSTTGEDSFNYTQFRNLTNVDQQYHFDFVWLPIVETSNSFIRTESPGFINESNEPIYDQAENRVHYGTFTIDSQNYRFMVTAHNGVYNTTYISEDWEFRDDNPQGVGDTVVMSGTNFTIKQFQNRERRPGTAVILENSLKSFGPSSEEVSQEITKLNRYAVLKAPNTDDEPVRVEVLAW